MKFSPGAVLIFSLAVVSAALVVLIPSREPKGIPFWVFTGTHYETYAEPILRWNEAHPESPFEMSLLHAHAIEQRMLNGFLTGTPIADLLETHEIIYPKAYLGPVEQIGFLDITDRIHEEGLYEQFNEPSFTQQARFGRLFGLPRQSTPVLLAYRSDLVEAAGITDEQIEQIETWEDYFRVMRPLMADLDGDGRPDRYLLGLSELNHDVIRMLVLQNDGVIFDETDRAAFANERNARTLATLTTWITGPERVCIDVPLWGSAGHRQRLDGVVIGSMIADWMLNLWKLENPQLAGKIKLMPIPAFERGGRRTSSFGSTMISINKRSEHIETCWEMAKELYTSFEVAEHLYRETGSISAYKAHWEAPFYHEPDPFCCGQPSGTLFIQQVTKVPHSPASPYQNLAYSELVRVMIGLRAYAEKHGVYEVDALVPEALRFLQASQDQLQRLMERNVFLTES